MTKSIYIGTVQWPSLILKKSAVVTQPKGVLLKTTLQAIDSPITLLLTLWGLCSSAVDHGHSSPKVLSSNPSQIWIFTIIVIHSPYIAIHWTVTVCCLWQLWVRVLFQPFPLGNSNGPPPSMDTTLILAQLPSPAPLIASSEFHQTSQLPYYIRKAACITRTVRIQSGGCNAVPPQRVATSMYHSLCPFRWDYERSVSGRSSSPGSTLENVWKWDACGIFSYWLHPSWIIMGNMNLAPFLK